ncbi:MAG: hypothetical protein JXR48_04890 [Candidatus Delongbacteria bacterium]|nr:hypothetical protein [Candidatus Delongbacteria bacterium]
MIRIAKEDSLNFTEGREVSEGIRRDDSLCISEEESLQEVKEKRRKNWLY